MFYTPLSILFLLLILMLRFIHPSTWIVAGPSQSGKTFFVSQLLTSNLFDPPLSRIVYAYSIFQPAYSSLQSSIPSIEFTKDLDQNLINSFQPNETNMLVIDDLMSESGDGKLVIDIFTKGSHHLNLSAIFIVQNIFHKCKSLRECNLNAQYMVLFKTPRDQGQIRTISSQMFPGKPGFLGNALEDACKERARGYLLLDLRNDTPSDFRVRTGVLPNESMLVYKPV